MSRIAQVLISAWFTLAPCVSLAATTNLNVQAVVSGSLGGTTLTRAQVRLALTLDTSQITGAVGSQTTPSLSGNATTVIINDNTGQSGGIITSTYSLTAPARITVSGATLSFIQDGGATITVTNPAFASADLRTVRAPNFCAGASCLDIPGSAAAGQLSLQTSGGTLSIAEGARFSFHNAVTNTGPGPGGITFSITKAFAVATTTTSLDVETFLTRLTAKLNGGSPVYDQTFSTPYSDPTVQAAINQARAAITTAAGAFPVNFTGPARTSTSRTLAGSSQQTIDSAPVESSPKGSHARGPAFIYIGDNEAIQFLVTAGNTNTDVFTTSTTSRTITTTNTYLTSEAYVLDGVTTPVTPSTGLRFKSLTACRLIETRPEYNFQGRTLPFGPPFLNALETRTFVPQLSTVCSVPNSAKAYVLNVTAVPRGTLDFVTVFPAGEIRPEFWTVRSPDGLIVANSAIVKAGAGGGVSVYASHATDLLIDIAGYFTDNPQESDLVYYPLTPCRVIETRADYRPQTGPFGPPSLAAKQTRNFRLPQSPHCQIPVGAAAYSVTLTVVPPAALPFLTAWPAGSDQPNVSSINSPNGRVLANSVIVPASTDGTISLYAFEATDVIVDINGYFAKDDGVNGLFYYPVSQCRVSNSTDNTYIGNYGPPIYPDTSTRPIAIPASRCSGIPASVKAYALNATVIPNGNPMPFLTIFPTGQTQPNASVINAFHGQTVSSGFIVPAGTNGSIDAYAFRRTHVAIEMAGYFGR